MIYGIFVNRNKAQKEIILSLPPIWITCPNHFKARREVAEDHFAKMGIDVTFFEGLYGKEMGLQSDFDDPSKPYSRMYPGHIASAINHWFMWRFLTMSPDMDRLIIFEDDTIVPEGFDEIFNNRLAETPDDWEFIWMGVLYPKRVTNGKINTTEVGEGVYRWNGMNTEDGTCDGVHAYMINKSAARKLTNMPFVLDDHIDRWLCFNALKNMNTYIWNPCVAWQSGQWESSCG